jgi:hypothetical protein
MSDKPWTEVGLSSQCRAEIIACRIEGPQGINARYQIAEAIDAAVRDAAPKFTPVTSGYPTEPGTYAVIGQSTWHTDTWHKIQTWTDESSRLAWYQTGVAYWLKLPDSDSMPHIANEIEPKG